MTVVDYFDVTWSPSRGLAIVRPTLSEIPPEETDEAAHQLLACGNLARRMNTPAAKRPLTDNPVGPVTVKTVTGVSPPTFLPPLRTPYLWRRNETKGRWEIGVITDRHDEVEVPLAYVEDRLLRESTDGEIEIAVNEISAEYRAP